MKDDIANVYLSQVIERLETAGFNIKTNITHKGQHFEYVARGRRYEIDKQGFVFSFFTFSVFPSLDIEGLKDFSAKSFNYAVRSFTIPLPRGLFCGIICYPVAIVDDVDNDTSEFIRKKAPPKHFSAAEMPVIYCLKTRELHYMEITPLWGSMYWDQLRFIINAMLSPD